MMLQLSVYLPTELEWLRCVRFVKRWLEKRENIQLHLNKRLWASASDAKKFNFEDKRRGKRGRCEGKEAVSIFFVSIHFPSEVSTQTKCDVSNFQYIFTMGLTMWWWLLKKFQFLIGFFFFSLFIYIFTEQRPHSWELCENSWIFPLDFEIFQNFRSVFLCLSLFVFNKAATLRE